VRTGSGGSPSRSPQPSVPTSPRWPRCTTAYRARNS